MRIRNRLGNMSWVFVLAWVVLPSGFPVRGLKAQGRPKAKAPYATPPAPASMDSMSNEALLHYIRSLGFDPDPWAGDEQRLLIGRFVADSPQLARYGPLVKIEPESGSQHLSYPELQRGRIVARLVNRDTVPYPKLALVARGVTYWWIEGAYQQDSGRGGRAVLITTDSAGRIVRRAPASLYYHGEYAYGTRFRRNPRALVRWAWLDNDEQGWYPCPQGCCRVGTQ